MVLRNISIVCILYIQFEPDTLIVDKALSCNDLKSNETDSVHYKIHDFITFYIIVVD
jgi:hypothetical protein